MTTPDSSSTTSESAPEIISVEHDGKVATTPQWMRGVSIPCAILGIAAFFLPWLEISCGPLNLKFSGDELASGRYAEKLNPHSADPFWGSNNREVRNRRSNQRSPTDQHNQQPPTQNLKKQSQELGEQKSRGTPLLFLIPMACFLLLVLAIAGLPRAPTIIVAAMFAAYLAYFGITAEQSLSDPATTGGIVQHRWLFGYWAEWAGLLVPAILSLCKPTSSNVNN
jgi:hypothetical protein